MKPAIKRKWVKALLSGEYEQGQGYLELGGKFCCLGVLRHCVDPNDRDKWDLGELLSRAQLERFDITGDIQNSFADLNDGGVPFDMVAGLIDEAL